MSNVVSRERHHTEELSAELAKRRALDDYAKGLAEWEDVSRAFRAALESVCKSMAELASMAAQVDAKRRKLSADHARLKKDRMHAQPPRVAGSHARLVMNAAHSGPRAALAAIAVAAKEQTQRG